ncbi:hypothetical protein [Pseudacidovorax sp. RU35E]|uniref:hypothetical protein n=1 Tax=Pseudacidovorax sp. RU35E TaxID=1907403 RepID=UPI000956E4FE|nr:hypothetical protein [Pseudacidovorax sp. RU35E]SIR39355.1 UDP-glucose/GDP-mannose dehydrogenase family, NAD binding domain [Pseudacidovorax sp. RU35E]
MNITVLGTGYVGLVTATCLAEAGHQLLCFDVDVDKIKRLARGESFGAEEALDVADLHADLASALEAEGGRLVIAGYHEDDLRTADGFLKALVVPEGTA